VSDPVRLGFVGVGLMGQCAHLKNYAQLPECRVAAIAEPRKDTARKVAARYGVPRVYDTSEEMLAHEKLDALVVAQPFQRHGRILCEALASGLPVFCEKPIAWSVETGEKVIESARRNGTWIMVGYHKRSDPATMYVKEEIARLTESGELGPMVYVRIFIPAGGDWIANGFEDVIRGDDPSVPLDLDPTPTGIDTKMLDAYTDVVNGYIHQINLMRHLLGEAYEVAFAEPTGTLMVGRSRSGLPCMIEMVRYWTTVDWQEWAFILFEHGWIKLDIPAPMAFRRPGRVELFRDPGGRAPETVVPQIPWVHAMRQQAVNFIRAVRGEIKPPCNAEEALEDLKIAREFIRLKALSTSR